MPACRYRIHSGKIVGAVHMLHVLLLFKRFSKTLRKDRLDRVLLALLTITLVGMLGIAYFESLSLADSLWWTIVTITTVGYGDIYPASFGGRTIGVLLMLFGIGFLGILTATLASTFIEERRQEGKGVNRVTVSQHLLICGWSYKAKEIVEEVRADDKTGTRPLVVIADLPEKPLEDEYIHFVSGVVTKESLEKANAQEAQAAIVLSDENVEVHTRDAKTILDTLTIKSAYPDLYTSVELVDPKNVEHCRLAKADEIIVSGELSTSLLVRASLDHGVTQIITELVSSRFGSEIYKTTPPKDCVGESFLTVFTKLKTDQNVIVLAVESKHEGRFLANPPNSYIIGEKDRLIVVGEDRSV